MITSRCNRFTIGFALLFSLGAATSAALGADASTVKTKAPPAWPWTPLVEPDVPDVQRADWVKNPIDAFILSQLEAKKLEPAPPASPRAALRRLHYGVLGLPPTPEHMQAFLTAPDDNSWSAAIEAVLDDPGYGERWGRHWLDLVRYADTRGGAIDYPRPHMWRYRDYVIRALNQDRPYNRFIREQLAGDAYSNYGDEAKLGLAYLSLWVQVERVDSEQIRRDYLNDVVGTTGSVFLGMTLECAQCHDHKFDPIPARDYFRMEAFFSPLLTEAKPLPFTQYEAPNRDPEAWERDKKAWEDLLKRRQEFVDKKHAEFTERVRQQRQLIAPFDVKSLALPLGAREVGRQMGLGVMFTKEERELHSFMARQTARFANPNAPDYYQAKAYMVRDSSLKDRVSTYVLAGGNFRLRGEEVKPGFLTAATGNSNDANLDGLTWSRRRLLADWIASPENPLTARVMVNRIWQYHFGKGLVATPSDLGKNGSGTVHEKLLDWLAVKFIDSGWSWKAVHRLILASNTYRQAMTHPKSAEFETIDPLNEYLWVRDPLRVEAEVIRDTTLAMSGELNPQRGGPPFFPAVSDQLMQQAPTWWEPSSRSARSRRSVYMLQFRSLQHPMLKVFNGPNIDESCPVRGTNTTTPQVLALFNSEFMHEQSRFMAERVASEVGNDPRAQVERAFQLAFQRPPSADESERCVAFLDAEPVDLTKASAFDSASESTLGRAADSTAAADEVAAPATVPASVGNSRLADLCLVLFNTSEFIYLE